MKRINILKGIEQILIQKAYETGHISHRADGDWQKTNDGWKRISGYDKGSHQWKSDKRQRSLTADEIQELQQISNIDERRKRQSEMLSQPAPQAQGSTGNTKYGEITEEDLKGSSDPTPIKNKLSKEEKANINNKLYDVLNFYSLDSKELFGMKRTNNGELDGSPSISYDWKTDKILPTDKDRFDKIVRHYMDKADIEDTPLNYKQAYNTIKGMAINNGMLNRTNHPLDTVDKSYRDMRSVPTTKNMGF